MQKFAIFSYRVPKELCSNGESRGLGRPLIKWSGISHCDPSAECEVPLFPRGMHSLLGSDRSERSEDKHSLLGSRSFGAKRR